MTWQDAVLTAGGFAIAGSLVPTIRNRRARVPLWTSATFVLALAAFVAAYASLGLWWSVAGTVVQVGCWAFVAVRRRA